MLRSFGNFPGCMHRLVARGLSASANAKEMTLSGCGDAVLGLKRLFEVSFALCESRVEIRWLWH